MFLVEIIESGRPARNRDLKMALQRLHLLFVIIGVATAGRSYAQTAFDFDRPGLSDSWSVQGNIKVQRSKPSHGFSGEPLTGQDAPSQDAVQISAKPQSAFFSKPNVVPKDWSRFEAVSLWVYRTPEETEPSVVEFQVFENDTRVRFWRKIAIDHKGWKKYVVPLRWMRWSDGRIPAWDRVSRMGISFRNTANLWVDSIRLQDENDKRGAMLTAEDLIQMAFNDRPDASITKSGRIRVISAVKELDHDQLLKHLSEVSKELKNDFQLKNRNASAVTLVVCDDIASYHRFAQDFVSAFNSQGAQPTSSGTTIQGVPFSYWSPRHGTQRPVFTHEFVHAWIINQLRIDNPGDWLNEGIATYYQLKFHEQANIHDLVLQGIENRQLSDPLKKLCNGKRISTNRYWQAMTMVEMLMKSKRYRRQFPLVLETVQRSGSTDLEQFLTPVLKTNWNKLTDDWREFCRETYAK